MFISHFIRYARICRNYADIFFSYRVTLLTVRLLESWARGLLLFTHSNAHWEPFVRHVIVFSLSSTPAFLTFYEQLDGCFLKSRRLLPYRYTWSMLPRFLVEYGLLISYCVFVRIILVISCSLLCVSVFPICLYPWIFIRILSSLNTFSGMSSLDIRCLRFTTQVNRLIKCRCHFDQTEVMTKSKRKVRTLDQMFKRMRETSQTDDITESAAVQTF